MKNSSTMSVDISSGLKNLKNFGGLSTDLWWEQVWHFIEKFVISQKMESTILALVVLRFLNRWSKLFDFFSLFDLNGSLECA